MPQAHYSIHPLSKLHGFVGEGHASDRRVEPAGIYARVGYQPLLLKAG